MEQNSRWLGRRTFISTALRISYLIICLLLIAACGGRVEPVSDYLNLHDSVPYVGKETCKQCHFEIYQSFMHTGMGQSIAGANPKKSASKLDSESVLNDPFTAFSYHPFWEGDTLKLKEFLGTHQRTETVDYIIGSGHHTNSHLWEENGYLHQMPFTYYTQDSTLDFPPGFEGGHNSRFSRKIGLECMSCHNAYPDLVLGSENKYSKIPEGIDCERCHGAGGEHVKRKMAGEIIDTSLYIDYSIVNPAKLPIDKQFQLCMRCHLQGNVVLDEGKSFYDFKPSMDLSEVLSVFTPRYENDESFIMASHVDRLKQSACFNQSEMSCITCHDPHHSVRTTSTDFFNNKCASCHTVCEEKPQINSDCVSCHMPKSSSSDIPHVRITDHKIGVHHSDSITEKGAFLGLFSINNANPNDKTLAKAYLYQFEKFDAEAYLLDSAEQYLNNLTLNQSFQERIQLYFLQQNYAAILNVVNALGEVVLDKQSYDNSHAWTAYRIGEAYHFMGQENRAIEYYQKAINLAPFVLDFQMKLASVYASKKQFKQATNTYQSILKEFPKHESAWCNLGFTLLQQQNFREANTCYDQALALNPQHIQSLLNKAALMLMLGDILQGKLYLKKVLKVQPNHPKAIVLLKEING